SIMLALLLVYYLAQTTRSDAGPIPAPLEPRAVSSCGDQDATRTVWGVVWSCLSTIFLCTWVAVHPNVAFRPEKRDAGWFETWIRDRLHDFFTYKLLLFSWPLLVPEYILSWAVRQYVRADQIQKQGNFSSRNISRIPTKSLVPGWTKSHGFFVLMGGFHLFRLPPDAPSIPLPLKSSSPSDFIIPLG
ncbi:hypothetical protein M408DRAFT_74265, partial [Serendipita vermifera MAFF 305830]